MFPSCANISESACLEGTLIRKEESNSSCFLYVEIVRFRDLTTLPDIIRAALRRLSFWGKARTGRMFDRGFIRAGAQHARPLGDNTLMSWREWSQLNCGNVGVGLCSDLYIPVTDASSSDVLPLALASKDLIQNSRTTIDPPVALLSDPWGKARTGHMFDRVSNRTGAQHSRPLGDNALMSWGECSQLDCKKDLYKLPPVGLLSEWLLALFEWRRSFLLRIHHCEISVPYTRSMPFPADVGGAKADHMPTNVGPSCLTPRSEPPFSLACFILKNLTPLTAYPAYPSDILASWPWRKRVQGSEQDSDYPPERQAEEENWRLKVQIRFIVHCTSSTWVHWAHGKEGWPRYAYCVWRTDF
ncbi:hypothetical protein EDD15DRAFT_2432887 [Pisolithus albus]|nr:hypothetical protein EDD15DRAFT_2432887 [Pisolithus albus]